MPRYGEFQYGEIERYGKYELSNGGVAGMSLGPLTPYRIRTYDSNGKMSFFVTMMRDRISVPSNGQPIQFRMRANNGEWVRTQNDYIQDQAFNVRIRSIDSKGNKSEWVEGVRGDLT
jgi:hypothetical protein